MTVALPHCYSFIDDNRHEDVKKFYDFWWNFKSWRDFSFDDEHDVDQADSRDEKRWMERQNEKKRSKMKVEERARVIRLTGNALRAFIIRLTNFLRFGIQKRSQDQSS